MNLELIILGVNAVIILTMKVLKENRKQKIYKQLHFWIRKRLIKCRRITMRNMKCQFNVKIMNEDR